MNWGSLEADRMIEEIPYSLLRRSMESHIWLLLRSKE